MRAINRGLRSTMLAAVTAVGPLNAIALVWWLIRDRTLGHLGSRVVLLWAVPFLLVFVLIHIAKPGYVLPLLPLGVLVLATMYSRLRPMTAALLIAAQAIVNVWCFGALEPFPDTWTGGPARYGSKSLVQRAASDLQAVTYPTASTIAQSERSVEELLSYVRAQCRAADPLIVAGTDPVDWRRVVVYLPEATAVHIAAGRVQFITRGRDFRPISGNGMTFRATCGGLWLTRDARSTEVPLLSGVKRVEGLGFALPPGEVRISPDGITIR
jgi:hypothetical protein